MHRDTIVLSHLAGVKRGMHSKQFVTELHDRGVTCDEAIEMVSLVFGVPRGAARLFIVSHPVWASESASNDSDEFGLGNYTGGVLPGRKGSAG